MTTLDRARLEPAGHRTPTPVLRPATLQEALSLLTAEGSTPLGGGVALTLARHDRRTTGAGALVALHALPELCSIDWTEQHVVIGAGVRLSTLASDSRLADAWPVLTEAAGSVATGRIRRMVTLGGNIAARDDSHDPPVALVTAGAVLTVRSKTTTRSLRMDEPLVLAGDEIIQDVRVPLSSARTGSAYEKFLVRGLWEYACVNVGAVARLDDDGRLARLSVAVGSVEGGPVAIDVGGLLGAAIDDDLLAEAGRLAAVATRPRGDVKGSAAYKTQMIAEFTRRATATAVRRARALTSRGEDR